MITELLLTLTPMIHMQVAGGGYPAGTYMFYLKIYLSKPNGGPKTMILGYYLDQHRKWHNYFKNNEYCGYLYKVEGIQNDEQLVAAIQEIKQFLNEHNL